jgi:hypothetical protein
MAQAALALQEAHVPDEARLDPLRGRLLDRYPLRRPAGHASDALPKPFPQSDYRGSNIFAGAVGGSERRQRGFALLAHDAKDFGVSVGKAFRLQPGFRRAASCPTFFVSSAS